MKLLLFHARQFAFQVAQQTLHDAVRGTPAGEFDSAVVVFVHAEARDEARGAPLLKRAERQIRWMVRKHAAGQVVLHSFAHLATSKAAPGFARTWLEQLAERLQGAGLAVAATPFGFSCEWQMAVGGDPATKVFVSF